MFFEIISVVNFMIDTIEYHVNLEIFIHVKDSMREIVETIELKNMHYEIENQSIYELSDMLSVSLSQKINMINYSEKIEVKRSTESIKHSNDFINEYSDKQEFTHIIEMDFNEDTFENIGKLSPLKNTLSIHTRSSLSSKDSTNSEISDIYIDKHVIEDDSDLLSHPYFEQIEEEKVILRKLDDFFQRCKEDAEHRSNIRAEHVFKLWKLEGLTLSQVIDRCLKDYSEMYEKAQIVRLQFEYEKQEWQNSLRKILDASNSWEKHSLYNSSDLQHYENEVSMENVVSEESASPKYQSYRTLKRRKFVSPQKL